MSIDHSIHCPHCHTAQRGTARFCAKCGGAIGAPSSSAPNSPAPPFSASSPPQQPFSVPSSSAPVVPRWRNPRVLMASGITLAVVLIIAAMALWWWPEPASVAEAEAPPGAPVPTTIGGSGDTEPGVSSGATPTAVATFAPTPVGTPPDPGELPQVPTLEQLLEKYPELAPWVNNLELDDEKLKKLYDQMLKLHEQEGVEGMQQFLRESGLLEALNLDPNYIDFVIAYREGGLEKARELARQRGFLTEDDELMIYLLLDTTDKSEVEQQLEALGFKVMSSYENELSVAIPLATLEGKSDEEVIALLVQLSTLDHVIGVKVPNLIGINRFPHAKGMASQGVEKIGTNAWQTAGFTGQQVKIGILDLSFAGYQELAGSVVPTNMIINNERGFTAGSGHGTASAETIHAIAPDAQLYLAWFDGTPPGLGQAVDWLLSQDVDVIASSVGNITGPMDGSGFLVELVNKATAADVLWVNASGNQGTTHLLMDFTDGDGDGYHEFPSGSEALALTSGSEAISIALNWNESWQGGAEQNYDMLLFEGEIDDVPEARGTNPQSGRSVDFPYERIDYRSSDPSKHLFLVIRRADATQPVRFNLLVSNGQFANETPMPAYSIITPGDASNALTVGATFWRDDQLAPYSSQGPTLDERQKPDLTAPSEVDSSVFGEFAGTSASVSHVVGAAALVKSAFPNSNPESIRGYLLGHALDLAPDGYDTSSGYGRLALPAPPTGSDDPPPEQASATLLNIWTDHNVYEEAGKGMRIHAAYDIEGGQGKPLSMWAYFFDATTDQPLLDQNGQYVTAEGKVAATHNFELTTSPARISDMSLFIPYDELDLPPAQHQLGFRIILQQDNPSAELVSSDLQTFSFQNNGPDGEFIGTEPITVNYDAVRNGNSGMEFEVDFNMKNQASQDGWMVILFYFNDGTNRALLDINGVYRNYRDHVIVAQTFEIPTNDQNFEDLNLFLPYSELHLAPGHYNLKFFAGVYDQQWTKLNSTDWYEFDYTQR